MMKTKTWIMAQSFSGPPKQSDFKIVEEELPPLKDGELLLEAVSWSVDPYMRPYMTRFPAGSKMIGEQLAKIIESKHKDYSVGTLVLVSSGWCTHSIVSGNLKALKPGDVPTLKRLPDIGDLPPSLGLGILGMPGATAYFGLLRICNPQPGEIVLVNAAAGAVGSAVGQIAKIKGCVVIGYAGDDAKVQYLKELGFDHAFNYKTSDLSETLSKAAPNGVDCYFDNVGGQFSATVVNKHMRPFGRMAICGCISGYNDAMQPTGQLPWVNILFNQIKIEGFIVYRWVSEYGTAVQELADWIKQGKLKYREHVTTGFENMPAAFMGLLHGDNVGKAIVKA